MRCPWLLVFLVPRGAAGSKWPDIQHPTCIFSIQRHVFGTLARFGGQERCPWCAFVEIWVAIGTPARATSPSSSLGALCSDQRWLRQVRSGAPDVTDQLCKQVPTGCLGFAASSGAGGPWWGSETMRKWKQSKLTRAASVDQQMSFGMFWGVLGTA